MVLSTLAKEITTLQQQSIPDWLTNGIHFSYEGLMQAVAENHSFNFQLWHTEDKARRDDQGFEYVYHAKRSIDHFNQQRNNRMEIIDDFLTQWLLPASHTDCPVHSETPGMMIDRLSILSLKVYYMRRQTQRPDVDDQHLKTCQEKLQTLETQLQQLETCLDLLLHEVAEKKRTFRLYRQCKMYNDPKLNPELYQPKTS